MHWTDKEFIKTLKGFKYGFLRHSGRTASDTPPEAFVGYDKLEDIINDNKINDSFPKGTNIFYGVSPSEGLGGMPPHHHLMAYIFPKEGSIHKPRWWVLGYVVELWRYNDDKN